MPTETQTSETYRLLRDLARELADEPEAIELGEQIAEDGAAYYAMRCALRDEPRLVGRKGLHVDALALIVHMIGEVAGAMHTFRLVTLGAPKRRGDEYRDAITYDPAPLVELLKRTLEAIGCKALDVRAYPGKGPRTSLKFDFEIYVGSVPDRDGTILPRGVIIDRLRTRNPKRPEPLDVIVPIKALEALFFAMGCRHGVRLELRIVD